MQTNLPSLQVAKRDIELLKALQAFVVSEKADADVKAFTAAQKKWEEDDIAGYPSTVEVAELVEVRKITTHPSVPASH